MLHHNYIILRHYCTINLSSPISIITILSNALLRIFISQKASIASKRTPLHLPVGISESALYVDTQMSIQTIHQYLLNMQRYINRFIYFTSLNFLILMPLLNINRRHFVYEQYLIQTGYKIDFFLNKAINN